MAKLARSDDQIQQPEPGVPFDQESITYVPSDGDPNSTKMHGITFHANVPKQLSGDHPLVAKLKEFPNRFFHVGTFDIGKHSSEAKKGDNPDPTDGPSYRAHVLRWFMALDGNSASSFENFVARWASEEPVRKIAEGADANALGTDDYLWLGDVIRPRLADMQKAAGLNDEAAAQVWMQHGVLQLRF